MTNSERIRIPVREGLFADSSNSNGTPPLIASRCGSCGEIVFPKLKICPNCQDGNVEEISLSQEGKIYSVTVVNQRPPMYYKGPVPYALGFVELPEGVRVETLFADCDPEDLEVGMDVELVIDKLEDDDEGNEVICYKFRPGKA